MLDLRGFISLKGVKALGNKLSALPVTEVSLEPPVEELEQALEQELDAARAADAAREATTETPQEAAPATPEAQPVPAAKALSKAPEVDEGGQASLF